MEGKEETMEEERSLLPAVVVGEYGSEFTHSVEQWVTGVYCTCVNFFICFVLVVGGSGECQLYCRG